MEFTLTSQKRSTSPLIDKALKTIAKYSMVTSGDALLVGVSGGADSVALLLLMIDISKYRSGDISKYGSGGIGVAHINHSLRGDESDRDEAFVRNLARKHNLPFHALKVDVPAVAVEKRLSFEEAARDIRYSFYKETANLEHYTRVALGHNSDDNAELVLMNLLRGSGTRGVAGIPPVRDNWIIRPLIDVSRQEILEYLRSKQQPYVTDSSNSDTSYLRNRIRHSLIPILQEEYNPSVTDSLNRFSSIIMDEESWMEGETERVFNSARLNMDGGGDDQKSELHLDPQPLTELHPALAKRVVRRAIGAVKGDLKRITLSHIDDILKLICSRSARIRALHLPDRVLITISKQSVCFRKESEPLRKVGRG